MRRELTRENIRRNPLAEWIAKAVQTAREHKRLVIGIVAVGLLTATTVGVYAWYRARQEHEAQVLLAKAYTAFTAGAPGGKANPEEAKKLYAEIAATFPGTEAAEESLIRLGNVEYDGGKFDEAIGTYGKYLTEYPNGRFLIMAGIGKAYAEEAKGDLPAAERTLSQVVEHAKNDPLAGEAYSSLAQLYEAMKKPQDALRVYNQIAERFPQTHWAQNALQRMSVLKAK
ncbi:MAG TPA: tetratricopeptide repeat protein [Nitrospira sp.]|nr:tetratricopeptide repeat protein [Nitrospira sp.]